MEHNSVSFQARSPKFCMEIDLNLPPEPTHPQLPLPPPSPPFPQNPTFLIVIFQKVGFWAKTPLEIIFFCNSECWALKFDFFGASELDVPFSRSLLWLTYTGNFTPNRLKWSRIFAQKWAKFITKMWIWICPSVAILTKCLSQHFKHIITYQIFFCLNR